jgi:hypothetical protein
VRVKRGRAPAIAVLAASLVAVASCRAPTNVIVEVSTDVDCPDFKGATVAVGQLSTLENVPESTESISCASDQHVGSVVLVPSGNEDDGIAFRVVGGLGRDVESCTPPNYGPGCIVARRNLRYFPHESLKVLVRLEASCSGIPCDTTETCIGGNCYPATIGDPTQCEGSGCDDSAITNGNAATITKAPVRRLALDASYLYWGDRSNGNLMRQKKSLDVPAETLNTPAAGQAAAPNQIVLDGTDVWWGSFDGSLYHCPQTGCGGAPIQVAQLTDQTVNAIAINGDTVYFTTIVQEKGADAKGDFYYCSKSQGCPSLSQPNVFFESPGDPARLTMDATNIYWSYNPGPSDYGAGRVRFCPLSPLPCANPVDLAINQERPWGITVDSTTVYWVNYGTGEVRSCPISGCNQQPTLLASNQGTPFGITLDGTTLYWANGVATTGAVMKCQLPNCTPTVFAANQDTPWEVAIDETYVYWANDGTTGAGIYRAPK